MVQEAADSCLEVLSQETAFCKEDVKAQPISRISLTSTSASTPRLEAGTPRGEETKPSLPSWVAQMAAEMVNKELAGVRSRLAEELESSQQQVLELQRRSEELERKVQQKKSAQKQQKSIASAQAAAVPPEATPQHRPARRSSRRVSHGHAGDLPGEKNASSALRRKSTGGYSSKLCELPADCEISRHWMLEQRGNLLQDLYGSDDCLVAHRTYRQRFEPPSTIDDV